MIVNHGQNCAASVLDCVAGCVVVLFSLVVKNVAVVENAHLKKEIAR